MADILTQLQDCLDQLALQMYASTTYIELHHPYAPIAGQTSAQDIAAASNTAQPQTQPTQPSTDPSQPSQPAPAEDAKPAEEAYPGLPVPDPPQLFKSRLTELAKDLVLKEQQIEELIQNLPGINQSVESQEARMKELAGDLRKAEEERSEAVREKERLLGRVREGIQRERVW